MNAGVLNVERVLAGRRLRRAGRSIEVLETVGSTNEYALSLIARGVRDGHVVFAEHQTAGRGRHGRSWQSPRGASVMGTVLLIESVEGPVPSGEVLGLIAGIATADAILEATGLTALIEWPNDVLVNGRKAAGVLVESRTTGAGRRAFAVGVGINCLQHRDHFPLELRRRATSLDMESGVAVDREGVAGALLGRLDGWLADAERWSPAAVREVFMARSLSFGQAIRLRHGGEEYSGDVLDLDPSASLVVQLDVGERRVFPAAETTVIREA
jgi:BirA family biotin operon repressor/biotin-[acetyl-CoA-carboxylase] ligase